LVEKDNVPLVFAVPGDKLGDRLDVPFYHPKYMEFIELYKKYPNIKSLREIADITRILGFETEQFVKYVQDGVPYLRVQNVKEFEIDLTNVKYIPEESHKKLKRSQLQPNDVILTITGRVGTAAVVPDGFGECNASQEIIRIRLRDKSINPYYIAAYLNSRFGALLLERWQSGSSRPRTLIRNIREIKIPVLPETLQVRIAKIIQDAIRSKKENESKIGSLQEVATAILSEQLNVRFTKAESEENAFTVDANSLTDRIDPEFYDPVYREFLETIRNTSYEVKKLNQITEEIISGQRPKGGVKFIEEGIPSIGGEHITSKGDFNFDELRFIPRDFHNTFKKSWVKLFDILLVKDGATTGKVAIVLEDFPFKDCNINEHIFKITLKKSYNPHYVFFYLLSNFGQKQIERLMSGAAQKGITLDAVKQIEIIIPDSGTQDKIAEMIMKRKTELRSAEEEAKRVIRLAKKQVEDIIERNFKVNQLK
jgi:type I restriction enzyme S subunit